ncbi:MAG TPA: DUF2125 domain-containing protein [Dongiaceae bacterium]|jgi:hypothetical protein
MPNPPTAYQPRSKLKRVFLLVGGLVPLAALLGGYYAYWRYVARQLEAGVAAWADEQRAQGNEVAFAWDGIGGFPFQFTATFRDPAIRWHTPQAEIAWQGAAVDAEMAPWNLREIRVRSDGAQDGTLHLAADASGWRLTTTSFVGVVGLHPTGALRDLTVALQQPDLTQPNGSALAGGKATWTLDLPEMPPADFKAPLARVALELEAMAVPAGVRLLTEDPVQLLAFDATIKGPMPPPPLKEALASWRDAGGVVDVTRFNFVQGPLGLTGNATVALDADLQPEGAGTVTATGLGDAVEILIRDGFIPPDRALAARATVKALEKPGPTGKPQATIGLSVQNRTVSFGPVPLFALQRIEWP